MNEKDKKQLDEQFLKDGLTYLERTSFREKMEAWEKEGEIEEELLEENFLKDGLTYLEREAFKEKLDAWGTETGEVVVSTGGKSIWKYVWLVVGILLLLLGIKLLTTSQQQQDENEALPKNEQFFAENFSVYSTKTRGDGKNERSIANQAFDALEAENFEAASRLFDKNYIENQDTISLFWEGVAHLGKGDSEKSLEKFETYQQLSSTSTDDVKWYMALAYVKRGDKAKVAQIAEEIESEFLKYKLEQIFKQLD